MHYIVNPGYIVESMDDEFLVCDVDSKVVHRLHGSSSDLVRTVLDSLPLPNSTETGEILSHLLDLGILVPKDSLGSSKTASTKRMSRRGLIAKSASAIGIGIVTLALPTAAAAASIDSTGDQATISGTGTFTDSSTSTTITRASTTTTTQTTTANWASMTVSYGSPATVNTINKTGGSDTVGVLTRLSNTEVVISLPSNTAFTLTIAYNGGRTVTYNITAV